MQFVFLDFETFYDRKDGYTLTKMSTEDYIKDPRFYVNGLSIAIGHDKSPTFIPPKLVAGVLDAIDWENAAVVAHNTRFDGAILNWHYGKTPKYYFCTLSMANQVVRPFTGRVSLDAVSKHLLRTGKVAGVLVNADGLRYEDIPDKKSYAAYANRDVDLSREIFRRMLPSMYKNDLRVMDLILRMYIHGKLELDASLLAEVEAEEIANKELLVAKAGVDPAQLRSTAKFSELLEQRGVEVPMKTSATTGNQIPALAKSDEGFKALMDHPDPTVQALCAARLGVKSTLLETRAARLKNIALRYGVLKAPLNFFGAHTGRASGAEKLNLQNLTRGSAIRRALCAPKGYKVVAVDASQIEARMLASFAGETGLLKQFRNKEDVYIKFARRIYNDPTLTKAENPRERHVGKTGILGLGYGCGHLRFDGMLNQQNLYGEDSEYIVGLYRQDHPMIKKYWARGADALRHMAAGSEFEFGPFTTGKDRLVLANGMHLFYPNLHKTDGGNWVYGKRNTYTYGAKMVENTVQAAARVVVMDAAVMVDNHRPDWFLALQVHDELVYVVPEDEAEECLEFVTKAISTAPSWMSTCPLAAEGGIADRYGDIDK